MELNATPARFMAFWNFILTAVFLATGCVQNTGGMPDSGMAGVVAIVMETAVHDGVEATMAAQRAIAPVVPQPSASPPSELPAAPTPTPVCRLWLTIEQGIALRDGPGPAYREVGYLGAGQSAEVVGRDTFYTWWIISVGGRSVWVSGLAVSLNDCANYPAVATPPPLP